MKEPDPLLIPDTPPEIGRDFLVVKEDDERTVSMIDSTAKDVSLNRQITQAIRHAPAICLNEFHDQQGIVAKRSDYSLVWM
jgi:hypothetical protein